VSDNVVRLRFCRVDRLCSCCGVVVDVSAVAGVAPDEDFASVDPATSAQSRTKPSTSPQRDGSDSILGQPE